MKRSPLLFPFVLLLAACGGGGGGNSSPSTPSTPNAFVGDYSGTYQAPFLDDSGTFTINVSRDGKVTGTGVSVNTGDGTLTGTFDASGYFSGRLDFDGNDTDAILTGTLTKQSNGSLIGMLNERYGNASGDVTVVLVPFQT